MILKYFMTISVVSLRRAALLGPRPGHRANVSGDARKRRSKEPNVERSVVASVRLIERIEVNTLTSCKINTISVGDIIDLTAVPPLGIVNLATDSSKVFVVGQNKTQHELRGFKLENSYFTDMKYQVRAEHSEIHRSEINSQHFRDRPADQ
ncbi:unnamed protein product, partial [Timema podura]|nr:unnamed protein product [Timema podura]